MCVQKRVHGTAFPAINCGAAAASRTRSAGVESAERHQNRTGRADRYGLGLAPTACGEAARNQQIRILGDRPERRERTGAKRPPPPAPLVFVPYYIIDLCSRNQSQGTNISPPVFLKPAPPHFTGHLPSHIFMACPASPNPLSRDVLPP